MNEWTYVLLLTRCRPPIEFVTSARRPTHPKRQRLPSRRRHGTTADDIWRRSVPDNGNADFVSCCGANGLREVEFWFDLRHFQT